MNRNETDSELVMYKMISGHEVMKLFDLELLPKGYYTGYDPKVNPSPANGFTAAAYRFGHSLVQNSFVRSDRFHRPLFNSNNEIIYNFPSKYLYDLRTNF